MGNFTLEVKPTTQLAVRSPEVAKRPQAAKFTSSISRKRRELEPRLVPGSRIGCLPIICHGRRCRQIIRRTERRHATCLDAGASAVDGAEVGLSEFSVGQLTETAAQSLSVDDAVVRGVRQVDVDAASLALRDVVRHHSVLSPVTHTHTHTSLTATTAVSVTSLSYYKLHQSICLSHACTGVAMSHRDQLSSTNPRRAA